MFKYYDTVRTKTRKKEELFTALQVYKTASSILHRENNIKRGIRRFDGYS